MGKTMILTGTFFCVMTTAESTPRTPIEVIPPWLIALKAYSRQIIIDKEMGNMKNGLAVRSHLASCQQLSEAAASLTNLVEPAFWRKDGDVSVKACSGTPRHFSFEHAYVYTLTTSHYVIR